MKKLLLSLIFTLPTAAAVPAQAQYVGPACVDIRRVNVPGGYDNYGNYYPPTTRAVQTTVPCNYGINNYNYQYYQGNQYYQQPVQTCTGVGAAIGAGVAGAITGGTNYTNRGSYNNTYTRNSSSGSWSRSWTNNNYASLLGAGIGTLLLGC